MPRRRCVGCGRIAPKSELLRIAIADHGALVETARKRAVPDRDASMPGRGAYLCLGASHDKDTAALADRDCLERAMRRGGISRALRTSATLDPKLVESPEGGEAGRTPESRAPLSLIEP